MRTVGAVCLVIVVYMGMPGSVAASRAEEPLADARVRFRMDRRTGEIRARFVAADGRSRDELTLPPVTLDGSAQDDFSEISPTDWENAVLRVKFESTGPRSAAVTWAARDNRPHDFVIAIEDESSYYGCGERFGSLNHKGMILPMVSADRPADKGSVTYKPIPYYMSTRGYAAWLDSFAVGSFDLNATERGHALLRYRAARLRLVLIDGPDFASMLGEFTRLSGRPRLPPKWSFAPWKSRNVHHNRDEVLADAELTRRHDLPGSVIVIDSPWETCYNDFILNERQFREPDAMFRRVRELGFHTCLWLTPFVNVENVVDAEGIEPGPCKNFDEAARQGFLVKSPNGAPMPVSWWKGRGGLVDFTNPAATKWWHGQIDQARKWGFRALKCDDGEGDFVQGAVFSDGSTAAEMKNRYAALYLQAAQEYVDSRFGGDGVLFARCGYSGTQRFPACWAGDNQASFSFENGLPSVILAGQNAALSGLSFWGHDIAGYIGEQTEELFIRWTQFGALSPLMQVHMTSNMGPWDFGERALAIYRRYAKLHTSLFPYIYGASLEAARTGMPIIRPMVLAFPNDSAAAAHRYQYMFGPDLLVAPVYQPGTRRSVYLPKTADGRPWIDFWKGSAYPGGNLIEVDAPLERIPLYARSGALLCMLPDDVDTLIPRHNEMSEDVVTVDDRRVLAVWSGAGRALTTWEDVSATTTLASGRKSLTLSSQSPRQIEVRRMFASTPMIDGADALNQGDWQLDASTGATFRVMIVGPKPVTLTWTEP